jgi:hypothetical protein
LWGRLDDDPPPPPPTRPDSSDGKIAIEKNEFLPGEIVYPNPFNGNININVTILKETELKISAYDILGALVCDIHSGTLGPGSHNISWDGENSNFRSLPSGIYFIKIDYPDRALIKRVTLLR